MNEIPKSLEFEILIMARHINILSPNMHFDGMIAWFS